MLMLLQKDSKELVTKRVVVVERESCIHGGERKTGLCGPIQIRLSNVPVLLFLGVLVLASLAEKLTLRAPQPSP
jgi:hypothetical protein